MRMPCRQLQGRALQSMAPYRTAAPRHRPVQVMLHWKPKCPSRWRVLQQMATNLKART